MPTKLLVADDSVTIQKVVRLAFAGEDVVIEAVGSGDAALEAAKRSKPNLILADVFMPGATGYEVCERVRRDPELRSIPVVLLVGTFESFDETEASRVGANAHLTKPFDGSELTDLVHRLVGSTRTEERPMHSTVGIIPIISRLAAESRSLVSDQTRQSFIGGGRILEVLEDRATGMLAPRMGSGSWGESATPAASAHLSWLEEFVPASAPTLAESFAPSVEAPSQLAPPQIIPFPTARETPSLPSGPLPEEWADAIVEKLVHRISQDAIREVAWEVVPELAEILIRQRLDERSKRGED